MIVNEIELKLIERRTGLAPTWFFIMAMVAVSEQGKQNFKEIYFE